MPVTPTDQPTRVDLYARVSTLDKGQDPETQLRPLRDYAQRRGFAVVEEYVDHGEAPARNGPSTNG
ncbi:recombinase family protein [Hymenobacter psychrophilus]|uniref:Resolvase, N terminal domain n=1 Tax=Hymenobacter psychrophilus TaxID=651662 RepID=A0A1H3MUA7_9BACT|nr:recombinase family protein [Hymenobacter psychrophilus]SDY80084.1 Resolvase, N terminal domain [Hymenobacter psychrophilus]